MKKHEHEWSIVEKKVNDDFVHDEYSCRRCGMSKIGGLELQLLQDYAKTHLFLFNQEWVLLFFHYFNSVVLEGLSDHLNAFRDILDQLGIETETPFLPPEWSSLAIKRVIDFLHEFKYVKKRRSGFRRVIEIDEEGKEKNRATLIRLSKEQINGIILKITHEMRFDG
jgi:hypothetical protein